MSDTVNCGFCNKAYMIVNYEESTYHNINKFKNETISPCQRDAIEKARKAEEKAKADYLRDAPIRNHKEIIARLDCLENLVLSIKRDLRKTKSNSIRKRNGD